MDELPDLPPLWSLPAPIGHNGGPSMKRRPPGRPSMSTPELRDRILDLLAEGVPMRVICRTAGMPSRATVVRWRRADAGFDSVCRLMQLEGYDHLMRCVVDEVERVMKKRGAAIGRLVFNLRREQLARMNPRFFGGA